MESNTEIVKPIQVVAKITTASGEYIERVFHVLSVHPMESVYIELTKIFDKEKIQKLCLQYLQ